MNDLALFNDLFNDFGDDGYTMPAFSYKKMFHMPKVDVKENKENYTLTMDMPGKTDKDVDIELNQNVLTVSSKDEVKKEEKSDKKDETKWLIRERTVSSFKRKLLRTFPISKLSIITIFYLTIHQVSEKLQNLFHFRSVWQS